MITRLCTLLLLLLLSCSAHAEQTLTIYAWAGEVPDSVVHAFEKETGINVKLSTFENNEIMYAKLRAVKNPGYDIISPSSYFVDRMRRQHMLEKLDKTKLPNWKNLNPKLLNAAYDPGSQFAIPHIWGATGLFYNNKYYTAHDITKWPDLWDARYVNTLMLLDDSREVFSMALLALGYSANDHDPAHIKAAFQRLKALMKNVKVFASGTGISIMIDEDATVGMAWNGDAYKAARDNPNITFVLPNDGFVIWVDTLVIPKSAPHKDAAYLFLNYMMRPEVAKTVALSTHFPTANLAGQRLLPENIRNNPNTYLPDAKLRQGQFQMDLGENTLALYEKYWEELKMSG